MIQKVAEVNPKELKALGRDPEDLLKIKPPFKRLDYYDVLKITNSAGIEMKAGDDLSTETEKFLTSNEKAPVFVVGYPKAVKPFYTKIDPNRQDMVLSADVLALTSIIFFILVDLFQRCLTSSRNSSEKSFDIG